MAARDALANLFYPPLCVVCGRDLVRGEHYFCTGCVADFPVAEDSCLGERKIYSLFYYSKYSPYRQLIYDVKYRSHRLLGRYLGRMLGGKLAGRCEADCIVPVPLHPKRERERGFNQSLEIARGVSEVTGMEVMEDVVVRVRNNVSQTGKSVAERRENVEDIFRVKNGARIRGRHVLLLDDVITTGATIGACLHALEGEEGTVFSLGCLAKTH